MFRRFQNTQDQLLSPQDTQVLICHEMAQNGKTAIRRASARTRAFAHTTTAARNFRQNGRVMRVQLEENASLAARMMSILEGVAERGPVTRASEHA